MNQKVKVTSEHSLMIQILEMINAVLGLAGLYALASCFTAKSSWEVCRFTLYALSLFLPVGVSFLLVRKVRSLTFYALVSVAVTVAVTLGAFFYGNVVQYGSLFAPPMTLVASMTIFIVRVRAAVEQRQMQNDFAATHDGEENVFMEKWEVPSFLTRVRRTDWVTNAICYAIACMIHRSYAIFPLFGLLFVQILVYFAHEYLESFEQYIRDNSRVANMPLSMMKRVHGTIFVIAAVLLLTFMLPSILYGKEPLDGILQRLPKREVTVQVELPETGQQETMGGGMDMNMEELMGESRELPEWAKKLLDMIAYAMSVGCFALAGWALINKLKDAGREYSTEERDEVLFLDDVAEDTEQALYQGRKKEGGFFSVNAQIRRRYKKTIKKGTKGIPENWAAPAELEEAASVAPNTLLHQIYEKARYSRGGCEREDLELLNQK